VIVSMPIYRSLSIMWLPLVTTKFAQSSGDHSFRSQNVRRSDL